MGKAYSRYDRDRFIRKIKHRLQAGKPLAAACKEVGISNQTYRKWTQPKGEPPATATVRPLECKVDIIDIKTDKEMERRLNETIDRLQADNDRLRGMLAEIVTGKMTVEDLQRHVSKLI